MFCNNCGTQLPDNAGFCSKCGRQVVGAAAPVAFAPVRSRLSKHLGVLALLWVVYSILRVVAGCTVLFVGSFFMPHIFTFGWPFPHAFVPGLITGIGAGILVIGILGVAAGWGLWQREPWARMVALVLGVISLLHFPLGTALGIYTLWVLLPNDSAAEYARPVPSV